MNENPYQSPAIEVAKSNPESAAIAPWMYYPAIGFAQCVVFDALRISAIKTSYVYLTPFDAPAVSYFFGMCAGMVGLSLLYAAMAANRRNWSCISVCGFLLLLAGAAIAAAAYTLSPARDWVHDHAPAIPIQRFDEGPRPLPTGSPIPNIPPPPDAPSLLQ